MISCFNLFCCEIIQIFYGQLQVDFKINGEKALKIIWRMGKWEKQSNSQGMRKIGKPNFTLWKIRKDCEKIRKPKTALRNPMPNLKGCANPVRNPIVHFTGLCEIPTVSMKMKGHLKAYLKTSKACFHFAHPIPHCENPPPTYESAFSPFNAP